MYYSNIAKVIDEEYKMKQIYKRKQRQNCKESNCIVYKYQNICEEKNITI